MGDSTVEYVVNYCEKYNKLNWEQCIWKVCLAYNSSVHPATGFTPFFLMFGQQVKLPVDHMYGTGQCDTFTTGEYVRNLCKTLHDAHAIVSRVERRRQKSFYDEKVHGKSYNVGDMVWLHSTVVPRGKSRKLHHP